MNPTLTKYLKAFIQVILAFLTWPLRKAFPAKLKTEHIKIASNGTLKEYLRIVVLSDFHWDDRPRTNQTLMKQVIQQVNNLQPDLVFLTGDFVQREPFPIVELASAYLTKITSKYGVFAGLKQIELCSYSSFRKS